MLHTETVLPSTLDLLKEIQNLQEVSDMRLVGGTALALHIGHRKSVDLDLFGKFNP
jgi:class 3 adenylate cyclase